MDDRASRDDRTRHDQKRPEASRQTTSEQERQDARNLTDSDLGADKMGNNQLQGDDQEDVHNQRRTWPDEKPDPDGVIESFEKMDDDVRARRDLGKKAK